MTSFFFFLSESYIRRHFGESYHAWRRALDVDGTSGPRGGPEVATGELGIQLY